MTLLNLKSNPMLIMLISKEIGSLFFIIVSLLHILSFFKHCLYIYRGKSQVITALVISICPLKRIDLRFKYILNLVYEITTESALSLVLTQLIILRTFDKHSTFCHLRANSLISIESAN
jgi:hypothetical protein